VTRSTLFEHAQKLAKWTILAGCIAAFFRAVPTIFLPFQINYVEGPLLNGAINVARGLGAYPPSSGLPYVINQYGPPPYYLIALVVKLFGVGLTGPRLLVFAFAICSAVLIALLVRHWTGSFAAALIFGVLYLTLPTVQQWMVILRVDFIRSAVPGRPVPVCQVRSLAALRAFFCRRTFFEVHVRGCSAGLSYVSSTTAGNTEGLSVRRCLCGFGGRRLSSVPVGLRRVVCLPHPLVHHEPLFRFSRRGNFSEVGIARQSCASSACGRGHGLQL